MTLIHVIKIGTLNNTIHFNDIKIIIITFIIYKKVIKKLMKKTVFL